MSSLGNLICLLVAFLVPRSSLAEFPYDSVCEVSYMLGDTGTGGSGALIGVAEGGGLVLTCAHFLGAGEVGRFTCVFPGDPVKYEGQVLDRDDAADLLNLAITPKPKAAPLIVETMKNADPPFTVVGYPYDGGLRFIKSDWVGTNSERESLYTGLSVVSGFSGGPMLNRYGEVVGVLLGGFSANQRDWYNRCRGDDVMVEFAKKRLNGAKP